MSGGDYRWHQKINQTASQTYFINSTGASGVSLLTGYTGAANFGFHVQILEINVTTGASGVTWSLQDGVSGSSITGLLPMDTAPMEIRRDFGDSGFALTSGNGLYLNASASGAVATVRIEGYRSYKGGASVGVFPASGASGTTP